MSVAESHPRAAAIPRGMTRIMDFEDPETGQPALWFYYFIGEYGPDHSAVMQRFIIDTMKKKDREQAEAEEKPMEEVD